MKLQLLFTVVFFSLAFASDEQHVEGQDAFFHRLEEEVEYHINDEMLEEIRTKRQVDETIHPLDELKWYRQNIYLTEKEEKLVTGEDDVLIFRGLTVDLDSYSENLTIPDSEEWVEVMNDTRKAMQDNIVGFSVKKIEAILRYEGITGDQNLTVIAICGFLQTPDSSQSLLTNGLNSNLKDNHMLGEWALSQTQFRAFTPVRKQTVYHVYIRLSTHDFLPQYTDISNGVSLLLTDKLMTLVRTMHRQKFGEYFFRAVVMEYIKGPRAITFVSLAILLEPNEYNMVDIDAVWKTMANTGFFGEWEFTPFDYLITETQYVPVDFKDYLYAKTLRSEYVLDTLEFWMDIGAPSLAVMFFVILTIMACAWEGWCCRKCLEDEDGCWCTNAA